MLHPLTAPEDTTLTLTSDNQHAQSKSINSIQPETLWLQATFILMLTVNTCHSDQHRFACVTSAIFCHSIKKGCDFNAKEDNNLKSNRWELNPFWSRSKTHKRLKECFLIGPNRTKHANFQVSFVPFSFYQPASI